MGTDEFYADSAGGADSATKVGCRSPTIPTHAVVVSSIERGKLLLRTQFLQSRIEFLDERILIRQLADLGVVTDIADLFGDDGEFDDLPYEQLKEEMLRDYPQLIAASQGKIQGDFEHEAIHRES